MTPGQKKAKRTTTEAPLTEYEQLRNQTILSNSEALRRLGVRGAALLLNSTLPKTTKRKASAREDSTSLYEPEDTEDSEHGVVDKISTESTMNCGSRSGGTRLSKRVLAPNAQEQQEPTRMTRQRTREITMIENDTPTSNPQEGATTFIAELENDVHTSNEEKPSRGRNMGKGLDKMSRGLCIKVPLNISEGKRRPEAPMQAAKFASEGGIILRQHIPILPHWKHYKKEASLLDNYMGKVAGAFAIDTSNKAVTEACSDLLKGGPRQMRYKLKKKYFDGVPANQVSTTSPVACMNDEQWRALVMTWSDPKHMEKCVKNRSNREKVQCMQKTGSRSFIAHCHAVKEEKYKDTTPIAIDLFKDCHCSSKTGFDEPVKRAIAEMEAIMTSSAPEDGAPKTPADIIAEVLPNTTFLRNAGLEAKRSTKTAAARVEELEGQLHAEKQVAVDLREQMQCLVKQVEDSDAARLKQMEEAEAIRMKDQQEMENLKKASADTQALLQRLLALNNGNL